VEIAVVGASGFVGSHVVPHLVAAGHQVRAVSRRAASATPSAGVSPVAADVEMGQGLAAALRGVDAVVHLVAIPRETGGRSFERVNVGGVAQVVAASHKAGVRRIVHLSALGVVDDPRLRFLSSKWRGEALVRESGLEWVVLRPSLLFGPGDGFFNLIKTTLTWWSPGVVAIPGDGQTRFQPLSVDDLAIAVERSLTDEHRSGSVYELGGPAYLTYEQIVDRVMAATAKRRLKLHVPMALIGGLTAVTDRLLPIFPVSHDQIGSMAAANFTDLDAFERAFGGQPRALDLSYLA
jgi:NADH dehydrogenase